MSTLLSLPSKNLLTQAVALAALGFASQQAQATNYQFSWIGDGPIAPFTSSENVAQVNNSGQILGYRYDASIKDTGLGFKRTSGLYSGTTFTPYASLPGTSTSFSLNLNDFGQATGINPRPRRYQADSLGWHEQCHRTAPFERL